MIYMNKCYKKLMKSKKGEKSIAKEIERIDQIGEGKTILESIDQEPSVLRSINTLDDFNKDIIKITCESHTEIAMKIINKSIDKFPNSNIYIAFSGGKSSLVLLDIMRSIQEERNIDYNIIFSNTTIEYPDNLKYVRKLCGNRELNAKYIEVKPEKSFFTLLKENYFPSKYNRWCCTPLKSEPSKKWFEKNDPEPILFLGTNQTENSYRYNYDVFDKNNKKNSNAHVFHPVFYFDDKQIWYYIQSKNLEYNPLYRKGCRYKDQWRHWHQFQFQRNGCYLCPLGHLRTHPQYLMVKACYQKHWKVIKKCVYLETDALRLQGEKRNNAFS